MTEITRIAIDTSKSVFTLHGVDATGPSGIAAQSAAARAAGVLSKGCRRSRWRWKRAAARITGAVRWRRSATACG